MCEKCKVKHKKASVIGGQLVVITVYEYMNPDDECSIHLPLTYEEKQLAKSCRKSHWKKHHEGE